jgi:hypothetical protein
MGDMQISSGTVTINLVALQPGVTVVVTETADDAGNLTITITLPPSGQATAPEHASGVITDVGDDAFVLETGDGSDLRLHMSADALSNLNLDTCSTADVMYHQDAGLLVADSVQVTGTSTSGDCTPTEDVTGTIASVTGQGLTVATDSGTMTFTADPSVTDAFQTGDLVDVTYTQAGDGSLTASDVQYVEENASGRVTAVQGTNLTISDSDSGESETFVADATNGVHIDAQTFAGIATGDQVDVTYHQSAGHLIADTVCDNGTSDES